ncbi:MAG: hypothetical protein ACLQPH_14380 [Acidimicrobiales bacterium]
MNHRQRQVKLGVDTAATVLCAVGAILALADVRTPIRSGLIATALVAGTGWAATNWMDLTEVAYAASVSLAGGLSIYLFYALFFVEVGWWHPVGSVGTLLIAAAVGSALAVVRDSVMWRTVR